MRVLHVFTRFNAGGPARTTLDVLPHLARLGWENHIAAGEVTAAEVSFADEAKRRGVEITTIPGLGKGGNPLRAYLALSRLVSRLQPAVVHTNMARAGFLGRLVAWRRQVPARIHTFHGHLLTGYFSPFKTSLLCRLERALGLLSTGLIAVSPGVAADLVKAGAARKNRLAVIPPGIDLAPFSNQPERPENQGKPVVGWAGRMVPVKDPELLGKVAAMVPEASYLAVGSGPLLSSMRQNYPAVEWAGHCHEMADFYRRIDFLLLTSVNEGTPLVIIEALAAGIPVISSPAGGVADLLAEGRNGVLCPGRGVGQIANSLRQLIKDKQLALQLVRAGQLAVAKYDAGRIASQLDGFYRTGKSC